MYKFNKMESSSSSQVTKTTTSSPKKSFPSSLRALLCCQANKDDLISVTDYDNKPLQSSSSPQHRKLSLMDRFFCNDTCCHGDNGRFCVACYFNTNYQGGVKTIGALTTTEAASVNQYYNNVLNGNQPLNTLNGNHVMETGNQPTHKEDSDFYCEICNVEERVINNNNKFRSPLYSTSTNTKSTNTYTGYVNSAVENDDDDDNDDAFSRCSSCYVSSCEQCFRSSYYHNGNDCCNNNNYEDNVDPTEFSFYANQNFDSEALSKLLRSLDNCGSVENDSPDLSVTSDSCNNCSSENCHCQGEECVSTDTASTGKSRNDKDSGVGRTDESAKNDESSEQDVECTSPGHNVDPDHHCSNDSFTSNETQDIDATSAERLLLQECNNFREALENRCVFDNGGNSLLRIDSESSIEREIDALNKEMEQIQIECQQIYEAHRKDPQKSKVKSENVSNKSPSRSVPRMGTRLEYIRHLNSLQQDGTIDPVWVRHEHCTNMGALVQSSSQRHPKHIILPLDSKSNVQSNASHHTTSSFPNGGGHCVGDTSTTSAYNTGDSCRSTPLTLELTHVQNDQGHKQPLLSVSVPPASEDVPHVNGCDSISRTSQTPEPCAVQEEDDVYSQYEVMYTNQANLQHTMMLQQRLFQQKMLQQQQLDNTTCRSLEGSPKHNFDNYNKASPNSASPVRHSNRHHESGSHSSPRHMSLLASPGVNGESSGANNSGTAMEWVVKRRADGTRYITRRPMRSKFLKERAKKISEERCGMTTDDDAMSELKFGRYWTKEDRKRHLEKAKEYKRRKQEMLRRKMETLKEIEEKKKEPNILELSHRKMMKHKSKKAFDDFTTVQEMLVHGNRGQKGGGVGGGVQDNCSSPSKTMTSHGNNPLLSVTTV